SAAPATPCGSGTVPWRWSLRGRRRGPTGRTSRRAWPRANKKLPNHDRAAWASTGLEAKGAFRAVEVRRRWHWFGREPLCRRQVLPPLQLVVELQGSESPRRRGEQTLARRQAGRGCLTVPEGQRAGRRAGQRGGRAEGQLTPLKRLSPSATRQLSTPAVPRWTR